jgi:hypothetical protein
MSNRLFYGSQIDSVYMVTDPKSGQLCRYMSGDLLNEARGMLRIHEDDKELRGPAERSSGHAAHPRRR